MIRGQKLYRLTFSRSLAEHMTRLLGPGYEVQKVKFRTGRRLKRGEASASGLYAIRTSKSGWTLRIAMNQEVAEELCDYDSRFMSECWLVNVDAAMGRVA